MNGLGGTDLFGDALRLSLENVEAALTKRVRSKEEYLRQPVEWAEERAGRFLWSKQRETFESVRDHRRTAVKACHSTGKTATAAAVAAWWIDCHEPGEAFVLSTAPTAPQVKALLWREINRLHRSAKLPGRTNLTEWYLADELVAFGRKSSDYNEHAFQGIHSKYVLVIFDEACGITDNLWVAAESIASNKNGRILVIGNPDDPDSEFAKVCQPDSGWNVITVGYQDTPNFTGEPVPDYLNELLISPEWVDERREKWGEESALFTSKCRGEFPDRGHDVWSVVPWQFASRCRYLELPEEEGELVEVGIDIGGGGDRTVLVERRGNRVGRVESFRDSDPMATVAQIVQRLADWEVGRAKVDVTGIGWGVYGRLRELRGRGHQAELVPVNFGAASSQPKRFHNKRAELWWNGRELSRQGIWDLGALDDEALTELCAARYEIQDSNGKIKVEPKDEIIKRLGRSPDIADALLLAFYDGVGGTSTAAASAATFGGRSLVKSGGGSSVFGGTSFRR